MANYIPNIPLSQYRDGQTVLAEVVPGTRVRDWVRCTLSFRSPYVVLIKNDVVVDFVYDDFETGGTIPRMVPSELFSNMSLDYADFDTNVPPAYSTLNRLIDVPSMDPVIVDPVVPVYQRRPGRPGRPTGPAYSRFSSGAPLSSTFMRPILPALEYERQDRRGPPSPFYVPPVHGAENVRTYVVCPQCNCRYSSRNVHQC